jgi:hypothetical protein
MAKTPKTARVASMGPYWVARDCRTRRRIGLAVSTEARAVAEAQNHGYAVEAR